MEGGRRQVEGRTWRVDGGLWIVEEDGGRWIMSDHRWLVEGGF